MAPNEDGVRSISFVFDRGVCVFTLEDARGVHHVSAGLDRWIEGATSMTGRELHHHYQPETMRVVAGGRWLDESSFAMTWIFVETAWRDQVVVRFTDGSVTLDRSVNVNTGATARGQLHGRVRPKLSAG